MRRPSYQTGFARYAAQCEPRYRHLWKGLVGCWLPFLGPTGLTLFDISGNSNHGTLINGPTWVTGKDGSALDLPGTNEYVSMGDIDRWDSATKLSFAVWLNLDNITADHYILEKNDTWGGGGWIFFMDDVSAVSDRTNVFRVTLYNSASPWEATLETLSNTATVGEWTHLAITFELGNVNGLRAYMNGKEISDSPVSTTTITGIDASNAPVVIGTHQSNPAGKYFNGQISDVLIYNRALSANEVMQLYTDSYAMFRMQDLAWMYQAVAGTTYYATPSEAISIAESTAILASDVDAESLTIADSAVFSAQDVDTEAVTITDSKVISAQDVDTEAMTISEAVTKSVDKILSEAITISESTAKSIDKIVSDAITSADTPLLTLGKVVGDTINITDSIVKAVSINIADVVNVSDSIAKLVQMVKSDAITIADTPLFTILIAISDTIVVSESTVKQASLEITETLVAAESIVRDLGADISDTVIVSDSAVSVIVGLITETPTDTIIVSDSAEIVKIVGAALKTRKAYTAKTSPSVTKVAFIRTHKPTRME